MRFLDPVASPSGACLASFWRWSSTGDAGVNGNPAARLHQVMGPGFAKRSLKSICHLCYHYVIICYLSSESVMSHVTSMFVWRASSALLPKMRYPELALDVQTPLNQRNSRDKPWQAQNIAKIIYRICEIISYYFSVQDELTPTVRDCDILHKARPPRLAFLHQFLHLVELPHQGGVEASRISQQMRWSVTEWLHHDNILWETLLQMFMFNHRNVQ
jgi:hypothetical protein